MIKKLSSLVLVLFIAFSLTACGDKGSDVVNETANSLLEELDNGSLEADTDEVLTGEWFGWVRESDCWGDHSEDFQTALGYVGYDDAGNKYFEVYKDDGSETAFISMFIEDENTDTRIIPVIGEEDAWIGDTYLLEEEGQYLETAIDYDGSLYLVHSYTSYDESSGCVVEMFLRKDGALWDEEFDTLPPSYDEYKAALEDTEDIEAPVDTDTTTTDNESAEGENEFAGAHDFTLKTFTDSIETMLQLTVPDEGWCTDLNSGTLRVYNVPTLDDAYSNSPRIQFETKETVEGFDLHIDEFENLEVIESRVIGGIEMTGRTYGQWGMDWIEYVGQLPNGVAISIKITLIDIGPGTEGSTILDSVSFK